MKRNLHLDLFRKILLKADILVKMCLRAYANSKGPDQPKIIDTQCDQGLHCHLTQGHHCLLTESLDTTECMNGEQRPR